MRERARNSHWPLIRKEVAGGALARTPLQRPAFLAIASLEELVKALAASSSEAPDGFIVEHHTAGGHNASPVGPHEAR